MLGGSVESNIVKIDNLSRLGHQTYFEILIVWFRFAFEASGVSPRE